MQRSISEQWLDYNLHCACLTTLCTFWVLMGWYEAQSGRESCRVSSSRFCLGPARWCKKLPWNQLSQQWTTILFWKLDFFGCIIVPVSPVNLILYSEDLPSRKRNKQFESSLSDDWLFSSESMSYATIQPRGVAWLSWAVIMMEAGAWDWGVRASLIFLATKQGASEYWGCILARQGVCCSLLSF